MSAIEKTKDLNNNLFMSIVKEKCPNCRKGNVYAKKRKWFELPVMKDNCDACNYHFDREPGYFIGAMYISYALAVLQGLLTFLIVYLFLPNIPTILEVLIVLLVIFIFAMKNYKLSRIIYIHIFPY